MKTTALNSIVMVLVAISLSTGHAEGGERMYSGMALGEDAVWLSCNEGLIRVDKETNENTLYTNEELLPLTGVAVSPEGEVWVGGYYRLGIGKLAGEQLIAEPTPGVSFTNIACMEWINGLWVGAEMKLFHNSERGWKVYTTPDELSSHYPYSCFTYDAANGRVWFGVDSAGGLFKSGYVDSNLEIHYIEDILFNKVQGIAVSENSIVYLATNYGIYTVSESGYTLFTETAGEDVSVGSIASVGNELWYSYGNTLCRYDGTDTEEYALPSSENQTEGGSVIRILGDGERIWILNSRRGLYSWCNGEFEYSSYVSSVSGLIEEIIDRNENYYTLDGKKLTAPAVNQPFVNKGRVRIIRSGGHYFQ